MPPSSVGEKEFDPRVRVTLEEDTLRAEEDSSLVEVLVSSMVPVKLGR